MGRRRGRRTRRRRKTGRHGGFGSPGKNPNKKKKKVSRARKKLNKRIKSKTLKSKVKSLKKAVAKNKTETKKKSISASQSRKQVRQKTKQKIATRKKINTPSLGRIGRTLRNIRQPISGLSGLAINSVLGRPGIASTIAQAAVNNLGKQNQRTRDMSKLSPQSRRRYDRLSQKTGRDYSIRNPTFRLNMNMRDIAKFAGLDKNRLYNRLPRSIREAQVNKQFYGNPMKKGWHSSQRTGRGQGIKSIRGVMGPERDWLADFYKQYNIGGRGGNLDQSARDYWSKEAKTKGRDNVMRTIFNTAKAEGTLGGAFGNPEWGMVKDTWTGPKGRKHYSFENTDKQIVQRPRGPRRRGRPMGRSKSRIPKFGPLPYRSGRSGRGGGGVIGAGASLASGILRRKGAKRKANLQNKGVKRRMAKSLAAHMATRGI